MRKYSNSKDINCLIKKLIKQGWSYKVGKKHGRIIAPNGRKLTVPSTPSDCRAYYNFRGDVRGLMA